jgi:hypothetical protein
MPKGGKGKKAAKRRQEGNLRRSVLKRQHQKRLAEMAAQNKAVKQLERQVKRKVEQVIRLQPAPVPVTGLRGKLSSLFGLFRRGREERPVLPADAQGAQRRVPSRGKDKRPAYEGQMVKIQEMVGSEPYQESDQGLVAELDELQDKVVAENAGEDQVVEEFEEQIKALPDESAEDQALSEDDVSSKDEPALEAQRQISADDAIYGGVGDGEEGLELEVIPPLAAEAGILQRFIAAAGRRIRDFFVGIGIGVRKFFAGLNIRERVGNVLNRFRRDRAAEPEAVELQEMSASSEVVGEQPAANVGGEPAPVDTEAEPDAALADLQVDRSADETAHEEQGRTNEEILQEAYDTIDNTLRELGGDVQASVWDERQWVRAPRSSVERRRGFFGPAASTSAEHPAVPEVVAPEVPPAAPAGGTGTIIPEGGSVHGSDSGIFVPDDERPSFLVSPTGVGRDGEEHSPVSPPHIEEDLVTQCWSIKEDQVGVQLIHWRQQWQQGLPEGTIYYHFELTEKYNQAQIDHYVKETSERKPNDFVVHSDIDDPVIIFGSMKLINERCVGVNLDQLVMAGDSAQHNQERLFYGWVAARAVGLKTYVGGAEVTDNEQLRVTNLDDNDPFTMCYNFLWDAEGVQLIDREANERVKREFLGLFPEMTSKPRLGPSH